MKASHLESVITTAAPNICFVFTLVPNSGRNSEARPSTITVKSQLQAAPPKFGVNMWVKS